MGTVGRGINAVTSPGQCPVLTIASLDTPPHFNKHFSSLAGHRCSHTT